MAVTNSNAFLCSLAAAASSKRLQSHTSNHTTTPGIRGPYPYHFTKRQGALGVELLGRGRRLQRGASPLKEARGFSHPPSLAVIQLQNGACHTGRACQCVGRGRELVLGVQSINPLGRVWVGHTTEGKSETWLERGQIDPGKGVVSSIVA